MRIPVCLAEVRSVSFRWPTWWPLWEQVDGTPGEACAFPGSEVKPEPFLMQLCGPVTQPSYISPAPGYPATQCLVIFRKGLVTLLFI